MSTNSNKRIALNTLALYFRMLLTMCVSLYTSRLVLDILGVGDFGLYNVVGGVVVLMGFLNNSLTSSTQRFLNYEKGTRNVKRLSRIFGTSLTIHFLLVGVIIVLAETIGLWFLNIKMNIDPERINAANWVYQLSVFAFAFNILSTPYNAAIIANEKMSAFAYISIFEVILKLIAVFCLSFFAMDKLILYALLMFMLSIVVREMYRRYAKRSFQECNTGLILDKNLFREMLSFSGWTVSSNLSVALRVQGTNIMLNMFFGTLINATQGIATQINNAISGFAANFSQAVNPQIVKNYAAGQLQEMRNLAMNGARYAFFLMLIMSLPVLMETEMILHLWLKNVPDYTVIFVRLILIQSLLESSASVLATSQAATGKVKTYHMTLSTLSLLNLPVSYALLTMGYEPYITLCVAIVMSVFIGFTRLLFLRRSIGLSLRSFFAKVVLRCLLVGVLSAALPLYLYYILPQTLLAGVMICIICLVCTIVFIGIVGITQDERQIVLGKIFNIVRNKAQAAG